MPSSFIVSKKVDCCNIFIKTCFTLFSRGVRAWFEPGSKLGFGWLWFKCGSILYSARAQNLRLWNQDRARFSQCYIWPKLCPGSFQARIGSSNLSFGARPAQARFSLGPSSDQAGSTLLSGQARIRLTSDSHNLSSGHTPRFSHTHFSVFLITNRQHANKLSKEIMKRSHR